MLSSLKQDFQSKSWIPVLTAGLVLGVTNALTGVLPMAALVFSGKLASFLPAGIAMTLFSAAVVGLILAWRSSFVGLIAYPVAEEVTILGVMVATIARSMPPTATSQDIWFTIVAAIAVSSLLTGAALFLLGQFKLGELIRFLPYPVMGGFLAGLGFLITNGGFLVLTNLGLSFSTLGALFQGDMILRWLPALIYGALLVLITRRYNHFLILPGYVLGGIVLFYLVLLLTQTSIAQASQGGWLLGPFPENSTWQPINWANFQQANWKLIGGQLGNMVTLVLVTALSLLLVSSALELITERDMDLNRELKATGLGCLVSGLLGGMVGSHAVTTVLADKMGVRSRLVSVIIALIYLVFMVAGLSLLTFFPKPVVAGILMFIGLDLLVMQLYDGWFKLPKTDYAIVLLIMAIVIGFGFVMGVTVGLVVTIILFALNYSRIPVARYALSGASLTSHRKRSLNQERLLRGKGDQVYVLPLQGYIFFGTATNLVTQIRQRVQSSELPPPQWVLLDFRQVMGLDSSAIVSFIKLKQMARKHQFQIGLTGLSASLENALRQGGVLATDDPICYVFSDLDRGMEWCETQMLESSKYRRPRSLPLSLQLKTFLTDDNDQISTLMQYLTPLQVKTGETVFHQGSQPEALYFIESGDISTISEIEPGHHRRLQQLGSGTLLGEVEFYTQAPYSFSAIADQNSKLYSLSRAKLAQLQTEYPQVAALLSEFINELLATRLTSTQRELFNLAQ